MPDSTTVAPSPTYFRNAIWLALFVIVIDQLSKAWILHTLELGSGFALSGFLNIVHVRNSGAAFSFLANAGGWQRWFFIVLGIAASIFILKLMRRHSNDKFFCTSLALILGGALGNVIDRLWHGSVIDFIDLYWGTYHWPAFNVADSAISTGAVLFVICELGILKQKP